MTLQRAGGLAAFTCAATYLFGFALLVTVFAPLGDADAVVAFIDTRAWVYIAWNTTIYIINALALVVLVVALGRGLEPAAPGWAAVSKALGTAWVTLVLGAGMIANVAVEQAGLLYPVDPARAAEVWSILHAVELGLGGGNEVAGAAWILVVSMGGRLAERVPRGLTVIGALVGASGLATLVPVIGDAAGAVFGLGAIVWFAGVAWTLGRSDATNPRAG